MSKPSKIELSKLYLKDNFKDLIYASKNSNSINFKKDIKIYEECIITNDHKTCKLDKIQKSIIRNTFWFLVFIVVYIHIEGIGINGLKSKSICELKEKWNKLIDYENSIESKVKKISQNIIDKDWGHSIQKEKKERNTHKNVTKNCKNDSYIIKYNVDTIDFNFRIGLCIMKENKIQIWKSAKKAKK